MQKNIGGDSPTNGAANLISKPYRVDIEIQGTADYLFHRWNCESVEAKIKASKGSKAKKTDDLETFVYRNEDGFLCIPSEQLRMSLISAAKFKQDPRSTRKSAMDLYKAGFIFTNPLSSLGVKNWDYEDKRRVVIQRNSINRVRPAIRVGYKCAFSLEVLLPEYINPIDLNEMLVNAGRFCGIGDFRPTFGRFCVTKFEAF